MRSRRRWSQAEVEKLRLMATNKPAAAIAAELGRGVAATIMKAHELRISLRLKPKRGSRTVVNLGPLTSKS